MKKTRCEYDKFFATMGCVSFIVMVAMTIGLIVSVVNGFRNNIGAWLITKDFLNIAATLTLGTGITILFLTNSFTHCSCGCGSYHEDVK